jgi:phosphatidylinositol 4-kinase A
MKQLSPYLPESATQAFVPSPGLRTVEPSPWELLTFHLTSALLASALNNEGLVSRVAWVINKYVETWSMQAGSMSAEQFDGGENSTEWTADGELARAMTLMISLLGFLDAASQYAQFWTVEERLRLVTSLRHALTEKFMIAVETALSAVRNSRGPQRSLKEWKRVSKHYAAIGRPLGSMLLRQAFMRFVAACAALVVCPINNKGQQGPVLDYLQTKIPERGQVRSPTENALLEGLAEFASDEMHFLQNETDFLQRVGSAWQQRLASSVRGSIFTTFLCCAVYNEDIADADTLLLWLENTLTDPAQMTDENLAGVVLKCLPVLAKLSDSIASNLSRSLPRMLVQGGLESRAAALAAQSLTAILERLPEDALITTLYSLGNVLSTGSFPERNGSVGGSTNGTLKTKHQNTYQHAEGTGSTISLAPSDIDEPSHVYSTVIKTIVQIVRNCKDEKITALAISMLVQKRGRISLAVDAIMITETARLAAFAGTNELKSLLKIYNQIVHDALVKDNVIMLEAVNNLLLRIIKFPMLIGFG